MCRRFLVNSDTRNNRQKTLQAIFYFYTIVKQSSVCSFLSFISLSKAAMTLIFWWSIIQHKVCLTVNAYFRLNSVKSWPLHLNALHCIFKLCFFDIVVYISPTLSVSLPFFMFPPISLLVQEFNWLLNEPIQLFIKKRKKVFLFV